MAEVENPDPVLYPSSSLCSRIQNCLLALKRFSATTELCSPASRRSIIDWITSCHCINRNYLVRVLD